MTFATDEPIYSTQGEEATETGGSPAKGRPRWYAVQVASGCEKRVKTDLEQRIQTFDVAERIAKVENTSNASSENP